MTFTHYFSSREIELEASYSSSTLHYGRISKFLTENCLLPRPAFQVCPQSSHKNVPTLYAKWDTKWDAKWNEKWDAKWAAKWAGNGLQSGLQGGLQSGIQTAAKWAEKWDAKWATKRATKWDEKWAAKSLMLEGEKHWGC